MRNGKLHMIGNAHLDPVWMWQWQEGFQETKATFLAALDRMHESADFIFTSSSAAIYEWVEHNDPAMFEEIRRRVAEGRWQIVGGWWIQPDCNIPSGESFVRQGLYGQRYFKEKLGVTAKVGYNVDSFGHHGMLPQILKKSGMDYYVFMRPDPKEKELPGRLFQWESDDGSRVLAFRILFAYTTWSNEELDRYVNGCAAALEESVDELMVFYGVGNHGGGPTKAMIARIYELDGQPDLPEIAFSSPNHYFDAVANKRWTLPVVRDDLQHHASGCYAAHSGVKQWNRRAENALIAAEKFAAVAERISGQSYPREELTRAWKIVLFNQFHDILAGSSIEPAYEDARDAYGEATFIADRALNNAIQSLSWRIAIPREDEMKPIVAFNPHAWDSRVRIELECRGLYHPEQAVLLDDESAQVPFQMIQSLATSEIRFRIAFSAELPALGYRTYRLFLKSDIPRNEGTPVEANDYAMDNGRFRLEFDPSTGWISRLFDKRAQTDVFRGPAAKPVVFDDPSDTWSHGVWRFDRPCGAFTATSVRRVEHGGVLSVIRVDSAYGASRLVQDFLMSPDGDQIEVRVTVDWREQNTAMKLLFPVNVTSEEATYEIPYGHIMRASGGDEEPGQSWVDIAGTSEGGGRYGLSLLADCKYSYSASGSELALTVLRSPIYAHLETPLPNDGGLYAYIDQGIQRFRYVLRPHEGGWQQADTVRKAAELLGKPIVLLESYHDGPLQQSDSYAKVDCSHVVVSAIKKAEDNDDLIVRCCETNREATEATIALPHWRREIRAMFGPCEIKTFRVPRDAALPVTETDLTEWADGPAAD